MKLRRISLGQTASQEPVTVQLPKPSLSICRTNRTFGQEKTHGLIVDYIGIFDDVARALNFDEKAVQLVVSNIEQLRKALPLQNAEMPRVLPRRGPQDRRLRGPHGRPAMPCRMVRNASTADIDLLLEVTDQRRTVQ